MKQTHSKFLNLIIGICIVCLLSSCSVTKRIKNDSGNFMGYSREAMIEYQSCVQTILSKGTKEFFGNFALDENFFNYVASEYGLDSLKTICKKNDFSNPDVWYDVTGSTIKSLYYSYLHDSKINRADGKTLIHKEARNPETVLTFTGDLSLAQDVATTNYLNSCGRDFTKCFSADLLKEMRNSDVFSVNNEFCYSNRGEPLKGKDYTFRSDPKNAPLLKSIGVDFVNLANNHVYDYGAEALSDTLDTLKSNGIPYVGAGRDLNEAKKPLYYNINGRVIAFVSATQIERSYNYTKEATETAPGVLKTLNPEKYLEVIRSARANADLVICIVHWGTEGDDKYGIDQIELAEKYVSAGCDAIIGCHSHCLQGVSYIGRVPVFYSLGNFWFAVSDQMPSDYSTGLAKLKIGRDGSIKAYFVPCEFQKGVVSKITDKSEYATHLMYLDNISPSATVKSDGQIVARKFQ